jgi:glycosyltransferase involved in cell wall biosynthesis
VPDRFAAGARQAGWAVARSGRVRALVAEVLGRPRSSAWIGFCDRLPLLGRPGGLLVVQNPHLYGPPTPGWSAPTRAKLAVLRAWAHRSARRADRIVCSTPSSADAVAAATEVPRERIVVVPIPARDLGVQKDQQRASIERVLLLGDVYAYKRWPVAVEAAVALHGRLGRPLTLVHLGAPVDRTAARELDGALDRARAAGLTVIAPGRVDHERALAELVDSDVVLLPSTVETQGLPLVEALSVGVPVIASAIGPFEDLGGEAVRLVPVDEGAEGFADALVALDPVEVRETASLAGRTRWPVGGAWDLVSLLP